MSLFISICSVTEYDLYESAYQYGYGDGLFYGNGWGCGDFYDNFRDHERVEGSKPCSYTNPI